MIYLALTARLTYWRTIQTWHAIAAGWPAVTKAGRTRRRRHRAELRNIRNYARFLAKDRAQILENMRSNVVFDENDVYRDKYRAELENGRETQNLEGNSGMNAAAVNLARDSGYTSVISPEAITPTT